MTDQPVPSTPDEGTDSLDPQASGVGGGVDDAAPAPEPGVAGEPTDGEPGQDSGAGPDGPTPEVGDDAEQDAIDQAQRHVLDLTADLQRLQAEYLNYKRRVDRDREAVKQNATVALVTGLLPVLDDIDRAREHGELEGGFKAVAESLQKFVTALGLERFGAPGDEFDPTLHEALMHGHSEDVTTTTCDKVVQAGYRVGDRVVRAAMVTVLDPA